MNERNVIVLGAGFAGISAATRLADAGCRVTVLEKNSVPGGRARHFSTQGFTFDMGPSWYWMPDVFEDYFARYGKKVSDYYELIRLDPSYRVIFGSEDILDVPAQMADLENMFEMLESGSAVQLKKFLAQAAYKYQKGIHDLVWKPGRSLLEFADPKLLADMLRMDIFQSMAKHVRKFFQHEKLIRLMEFPVLFLGALPENTPALYSLMNYADLQLGTWYPKGGMFKIVEGMVKLAEEKGVNFLYDQEVKEIETKDGKVVAVKTQDKRFEAEAFVSGADYHFTDQTLLKDKANYTEKYWDKRTMAPSSLIFYLGIDKKLDHLLHHNLFFDFDFGPHAREIYENPKWPENPLFYVSAPSQTDERVAPKGCENLFILMPVAPGLEDTDEVRERYYELIMNRLETLTGQKIKEHVVYKRSYAHRDFKSDYHAYKGNAYGLANTLKQTAILKPSLKSKHLDNWFFTGQLTVPGPGVPPSLISGQVVGQELLKDMGWTN